MSRFHSLEITDIRRETTDSVSIAFAVPDALKQDFTFRPGQYLTLRTAINGQELRRSYSICSGQDENELRVAVKKVDGGQFSTFANGELQAGQKLDVMPPDGRFGIEGLRDGGHVVLIAAGSGVTPMLSIAKTILARSPANTVTMFYGNKTTSSIMFREALEDLKDIYLGRFSVFHVLSRESQDISILNGRLDADKIATLARTMVRPEDVDLYLLCGPFGMVEDGRKALQEAGAKAEQIRFELFTTPDQPQRTAKSKDEAATTGSQVSCVLDGITYALDVASDTHIVDAAHEQGVELPYSCKGGMCCTCRCKVVEGDVVMDVNYSLEEWELQAGFVLACQTRPASAKVVLDFDAA